MMDDKFYEDLSRHINDAFNVAFGRKQDSYSEKYKKTPQPKAKVIKPKLEKPMMQVQPIPSAPGEHTTTPLYESIEDYTAKTGKRFRMTKEQKQRELSREQAFNETYGGTN